MSETKIPEIPVNNYDPEKPFRHAIKHVNEVLKEDDEVFLVHMLWCGQPYGVDEKGDYRIDGDTMMRVKAAYEEKGYFTRTYRLYDGSIDYLVISKKPS